MKKLILAVVLVFAGIAQAAEPTMTITSSDGTQTIALSDLRKVTYEGDNMVITLHNGNIASIAMTSISSVTLQNMPQDVENVAAEPSEKARKVLINGVLYIEKDGQRFSVLGNRL